VTASDSETRRVALGILAVCALLNGPTAFAQENEQQPLSLGRAVALSLEHSSELALATARHALAEGQEAQARAPFRPSLFTGSGAAYTSGFPLTSNGGAPSVFNLSYVQTLFNPTLRGQARAAKERTEVERLGLQRSRDAVIVRTALVFLDLVQVRLSLDVQHQARDAARRIHDISRNRLSEGRELPIELVRAELSVARAEQGIIQLEGREDTLAAELGSLIGRRSDRALELAPEALAVQPEQPIADLVALALANSVELHQFDSEHRARIDRLEGARGGYWPSLDVVSQYSILSRVNNYDEFFRKFQRHNVIAGVEARWSIFNAETASAIRVAQNDLQLEEIELERKREEVEQTVRREAQRARELRAAREVAGLELKLAQENLRILQERYQADRSNLREVEGARLEESDKWITFLRADYESQQAQLELFKTTGQLGRLLP
jgi:outer membrane protein TolC